jgi:hypothetical protein
VPPASAAEALVRARRHARAAAAEALEAVHALLDAAALATGGVPAEAHRTLSLASKLLTSASRSLEPDASAEGRALAEALASALDAEIARWEERAHGDPEARAVLRAFLGLRELLWELGIRRAGASAAGATASRGRRASVVRPRPRVQRVQVHS